MTPDITIGKVGWSRLVFGLACVAAAAFVCEVVAFVVTFETLGLPVRDNVHGWLGPTPRHTGCVQDIGKVNYWTCSDVSVFRRHEISCRLWLKMEGFSSGE